AHVGQRPIQICTVAQLVGVNEAEVERSLGGQARQQCPRFAQAQVNLVLQAGKGEVLSRHLGVAWLDLQRDQAAVSGQAARDPDAAVATQGSNLDRPAGANRKNEELQEVAFLRLDRDRRQAAGGYRFLDSNQDRVWPGKLV